MHKKLILADDQSVFRTGAARIIAIEDDFRIVGQCEDVPRLLRAVEVFKGAIVVFAATLKTDLGELGEAVRAAKSLSIVILENNESAQEYLAQGVNGVVYRDVAASELVNCIRRVARGQQYVQQRAQNRVSNFESDLVGERIRGRLTPKELQIVALVAQGYKNRDIAVELKNSEQVIKNYLRGIFDKTGASDRLELALFTIHHRLLEPPPVASFAGQRGSQQTVSAL